MSKLKHLKLFWVPLHLKIHGRVVGAFSKITIAIWIGFALLTVVSIAMIIILDNLQENSGLAMKPEQSIEQINQSNQLNQVVVNQSDVIVVASQAIPVVAKTVENKQEQLQETLAVLKPIKGGIQLDFGWQNNPVYNEWRYHTGIDIKGSAKQQVQAIYKGEVIDIFNDRYSGLTIVIKDSTYNVYYGSLAEVTVEKGSFISANQVIGTMGSCDGEPYEHLHLAIKKAEQYIDPKLILPQE